ncbi:uncharacterized protein LOC129772980 [Toxorhynchites rutilus septentrionalis]|uniref:uncharacterized protein LOC129772980 n=1 Tax=Toxorhynchites rutilus septentrionalis TaxID=329112 RepID=UPI002478C583|nr:uncharacterized protein LOC129772980 [Toxorhynchites rutilus septentrionalis]
MDTSRTTPKAGESNCSGCKRPNSYDDMVACDECGRWWHYTCAGVTSSVTDRRWSCIKCLPAPAKSTSTSSSARRARLQLELQHLTEQKELKRKQNDLDLEKQFSQDKFRLESAALEEEETDNRSVRNHVIETQERIKHTSEWVEKTIDPQIVVSPSPTKIPQGQPEQTGPTEPVNICQETAAATGGLDNAITTSLNQDVTQTKKKLYVSRDIKQLPNTGTLEHLQELEQQLQRCWMQLTKSKSDLQSHRSPSQPPVPTVSLDSQQQAGPSSRSTAAPLPPHRSGAQAVRNELRERITNTTQNVYSNRGHNPLSTGAPTYPPIAQSLPIECSIQSQIVPENIRLSEQPSQISHRSFHLTQEQLTARQITPRDLPDFSGDPEEWPLFYSSYKNSTATCGYTDTENMTRLQRCLKGNALKSVRYYLLAPENVPEVMRTLQTLYGRPEIIINKLIRNVRECPTPKAEKLETLMDFGLTVRNLTQHLIATGQRTHLSNPVLLHEVVEKLPSSFKLQWAEKLIACPTADLRTFSDFMSHVVESVSKVCSYVEQPFVRVDRNKNREKGYFNAHMEDKNEYGNMVVSEVKRHCLVCARDHRVQDCPKFKDSDIESRWKFVHTLKLCRTCLNPHGRRPCRNINRCGIDGCQFRHHPMLHSSRTSNALASNANLTYHHCGQSVLYRIIPVVAYGITCSVKTFAFLDEGSSTTLVESGLAHQLGLQGPQVPLCLQWTANMSRIENTSQVISVDVSEIGKKTRHTLENARTVDHLNLPQQTLRVEPLQKQFQHLIGLPVRSYENAVPQILIGLRDLSLAVPLKIKEGVKGPIASKTRLGWCIYGHVDGGRDVEHLNYHTCDCSAIVKLDTIVRDYFNREDTGVTPLQPLESVDNQRAMDLLQRTTYKVDGRFCTGLLWKNDHFELPDSYGMALRRLTCLERRMKRDPVVGESIHRQLRDYQTKQYAHRATKEELESADPRRIWYLPLGAVTNPRKPGKVRLIWDAAAVVDGISLNTLLLPGPDMLTPLHSVLFRFRQFPFAVSSDIAEMFHQIKVIEPDRHSQRFLWRDNPEDPPQIFLMDVLTFGATSSPTSAQYAKNRNAEEFAERYPRAVESILRSHYVDNLLDSFVTVEEAKSVSSEVRWIHSKGGFHIRDWVSNSQEVIRFMGEEPKEETRDLIQTKGANAERVLGMLWHHRIDTLTFSVSISDEIHTLLDTATRPTKRQVLKCIMSLFDPLGLLANFLIHGKILMQEIWRTGIKWDDRIDEHLFELWKRWTSLLDSVDGVQIPRCYFQGANPSLYDSIEAHVFCDASEEAYSAVIYFRVIRPDGVPQCRLVAAKAKVAPLKYVSIPRLELMAAVLGVRLLSFVIEGHTIPIMSRFLWSDSNTVLAWIHSKHRKYRQFVACRVGEILTSTNESEWHWVPSAMNVADEATKWTKSPHFDSTSRWFQGPDFLLGCKDQWPVPKNCITTTDEEIRPCHLHHVTDEYVPMIVYERFSRWGRMVRTMAYVMKYISLKKRGIGNRVLMQEEIRAAEMAIWRQVQAEVYSNEVAILKKNKHLQQKELLAIPKSSAIYKLTPVLDNEGILRIDGRIGLAKQITTEVKYPVILPKTHRVSFLIIDDYHRKYLHANSETIVNEVRQQYYIPQLRVLTRKVARHCQWCKVYKAHPTTPKMAPLPIARLSPFIRPFSYTGLDYFGPIQVKVLRSTAKRYVALFTCLTIRAVHVEVAYDLSTESCIEAIRRFVCRRGAPLEIHSDNGRNFCGANNVLKGQIERIETEAASTFTNAYTKWVFIPPSAPSMGGSWERLVRSIKVAMAGFSQNKKLSDEGLQTLVIEAESLVNSRPLTYLPLDSAEQEALTPNHFLLGSSSGIKQPSVLMLDAAKTARNSWDLIQQNLNHFWSRWVREYLPTLTRRTKWFGDTKAIEPGNLVIIIDENRRNGWTRGRILQVIVGQDGRIRQAVVQTAGGIFRRPVSKLAVLDVKGNGKAESATDLYGRGDVAAGALSLTTLSATRSTSTNSAKQYIPSNSK